MTLALDFAGVTVLCVGDIMLDRFLRGDVDRISPEAPIPVIRLRETREMLGGCGNVAHNVATLGGRAILVGLLADDDSGRTVRRLAATIPGIVPAFVATTSRPTICKSRYMAAAQQVVRADEESALPLQPEEEQALLAATTAAIEGAGAVLLSDYGKGVMSPAVTAHLVALAHARGIPVFVDPKSSDFATYRGATCITPNLKELARASRMPVVTEAEIAAAARHVLVATRAAAILVTRSEDGMTLVEATPGAIHNVPARAREVFDVSGAGDTVVAAMALAHAAGLSLVQAMHVANAAAGVVVSKLGTATATVHEVLQEMEEQEHQAGPDPTHLPGLRGVEAGAALVARWKEQGLRVGLTNGCFDILHPGHVALLKVARGQCDRLVVALNTDASVSRLKGPARPVNALHHRSQVMAALRYVDCVVAFDEPTPLELIRRYLPDVLIKGADYAEHEVVGGDVVKAAGGRVFLAQLVPGQSTTGIVDRLRQGVGTAALQAG